MPSYRAAWLLPISQPPIENGWVEIQAGRILAVGGPNDEPRTAHRAPRAQRRIAILPGLVNAHTHLELSYLHGRIPPAPSFGKWVSAVMKTRSQYPDPEAPAILGPARQAIEAALATGTVLFGEVSNTLVTGPLLRERRIAAQVFHELTGFTEQDPEARVREARARADSATGDDVRVSVAPHAPYSVSAALFKAIRADLDAHPDAVSSVHLGETQEEIQLLRDGGGAIRQVLENLGRWPAETCVWLARKDAAPTRFVSGGWRSGFAGPTPAPPVRRAAPTRSRRR